MLSKYMKFMLYLILAYSSLAGVAADLKHIAPGNAGINKSTSVTDSVNMLYNSSFEITTNPDVPDGWARDYASPPWGYDVYSVDSDTYFHGKNSIRLGHSGKYVKSWSRHTKMVAGTPYTFSVYLKSDRKFTTATIDLANVGYKSINVGTEWQRYSVTGVSKSEETVATIHLKMGGHLWVDAAQLEAGSQPSEYALSDFDKVQADAYEKKQYEKLYNVARAKTGYSLAKTGTRKENSFDLIGAEYDFYTNDSIARIRCWIKEVTEGDDQVRLLWHLERNGLPIGRQQEVRIHSGNNEWGVNIEGLPYGEYAVRISIVDSKSVSVERSSKFRKLPVTKHEVRINRWGRFLVANGEPLLFYGFFDNLSHGGKDRWIAALKEMKGVNANGNINYIGGTRDFDMLGWALDEAYKNNQKVVVHLGWMLSYFLPKYEGRHDRFRNETEALTKLREVVVKFKDHPALLGWSSVDEPDNRPNIFTQEYLEKYYQMIKELDPYHPCIISHLTMLGQSKMYASATDIAVVPLTDQAYYDDLFMEYWELGMPVFTNPVSIGAIGRDIREPTPAELRLRLYKAIVMGARGFSSYTFRCNSMNTWNEFGVIGKELRALSPAILMSDKKWQLSNTLINNSSVRALSMLYEGRYYLVVVNEGRDSENVRFNLEGVNYRAKVTELFKSPTAILDKDKRSIDLVMPAQTVAAYEI